MKKSKTFHRLTALVVVAALFFTMVPAKVAMATVSSCPHQHDAECGYIKAVPCGHGHGEECKAPVAGDKETDIDCPHAHDGDCGYMEAVSCGHIHDKSCDGLSTIASFADLDENTLWQGYDYGEITLQAELDLPSTLIGIDTDGSPITIRSVTWESEPAFDPAVSAFYAFMPVLPEGYTLADGVTAPLISVFIRPENFLLEQAGEFGLRVNDIGPYTSVSDLQAVIDSELNSGDVTVTGTLTDADTMLTLNIPAGKTVVWAADYAGATITAVGFPYLIRVRGAGILVIPADVRVEDNGNGMAICIDGNGGHIVVGGEIAATGHAISMLGTNNNVIVVGGRVKGYDGIILYGDGNAVTMTSGSISATSAYGSGVLLVPNSGSDTAMLTVDGGSIESASFCAIRADSNSKVVINGGMLTASTSSDHHTIIAMGSATLSIYGGTIENTMSGNETHNIAMYDQSTVYVSGNSVIMSNGSIWKYGETATAYYADDNAVLFRTSGSSYKFTPGIDLFALDVIESVTAGGQPHVGDVSTHHDVVVKLSDKLDLSGATVISGLHNTVLNKAANTVNFIENTTNGERVSFMVYGAKIAGTDIDVPVLTIAPFDINIRKILSGSVSISGTAAVGQTLTVDLTNLIPAAGDGRPALNYQWMSSAVNSDVWSDWSTISTGASFTVTAECSNKYLRVIVEADDSNFDIMSLTSNTIQVAKAAMTGIISINVGNEGGGIVGVAEALDVLSVDLSGIFPEAARANVTYEWSGGSGSPTDQDAYTVTKDDEDNNRLITVTVTAAELGDYLGFFEAAVTAGKKIVTIDGISIDDSIFSISDVHPGYTGTALFIGGSPGNTFLTAHYTGTANDGEYYDYVAPPVKAGNYTVTVTLNDDPFYFGTWTDTFTVNRAVPTVYTLPGDLVATYGEILADVDFFPYQGFGWKDSQISVGNIGSKSFPATYTPADVHNYEQINVYILVTVEPKMLTITNVLATDREYDRTTGVALTGGTLVGVEAVDSGYIHFNLGNGEIPDISAGTGKPVSTSITLGGAASGNYTLVQPTDITVDIAPKTLTITGITAVDREYNGTVSVGITGGILVGVISGDRVSVLVPVTGAISDADVGINKPVTLNTIHLAGEDEGNYILTQPDGITVNITRKLIGGVVGIIVSSATGDGNRIDEGDLLSINYMGITPYGAPITCQWYRDGVEITGETHETYTVGNLAVDSVGTLITVKISGALNYIGDLVSPAVEVGKILLRGNLSLDVTGIAPGDTLMIDTMGLSPIGAAYSIAWLRDGILIPGAISNPYTIAKGDHGKTITARIVGIGDYSGTLHAGYSIPVSVPDAPRNLTAVPGNGRVTLSWLAPAFDGGSAVTAYQVSRDNGTTWLEAAGNTGHTFSGLNNGTSYAFRVRAVNEKGDGVEASVSATPRSSDNGGGSGSNSSGSSSSGSLSNGSIAPSAQSVQNRDYGSSPEAAGSWNTVNQDISKMLDTTLAIGNVNHVVITGTAIIVPPVIFSTLSNTNITVMMDTGIGLAFSLSGNNIPPGFNPGFLDLSLRPGGLPVPEEAIAEVTTDTDYQLEIPMVSKSGFGMIINQHYNVGAINAGKYANLYRFNDETGKFDYLGSYLVNDAGQAMFGITSGGDYLLTVSEDRPNLPLAQGASAVLPGYITVARGDTLSQIARRNGITLSRLLAINPQITNINRIRPRQVIRIW